MTDWSADPWFATTRVGRSPRGRNPSIRVQIPASPPLPSERWEVGGFQPLLVACNLRGGRPRVKAPNRGSTPKGSRRRRNRPRRISLLPPLDESPRRNLLTCKPPRIQRQEDAPALRPTPG